MSVTTRSRTRQQIAGIVSVFPEELWIEVLSNLGSRDIARACCATKAFANIQDQVWRCACERRWPQWYTVARTSHTQWKRQYDLLELREKELASVPSVPNISKMQRVVNARHRMVLTEWLAEVSWDWNLESTIVFKSVSYLDHYLGVTPVEVLSRFQLVGIACLRAAMGDTRKRLPVKLQEQDKDLDPQRFAYISDRTYTAEEVEEFTTVVATCTPEHVKDAPNPKMFLRSFWYRTVSSGLVTSDEMHIYTIASFFLQLSLLDLTCSGYSASRLAAAALSNSLSIFGKESWPLFLQQYAAYTTAELAECKAKLFELQAKLVAEHLRQIWRQNHELHGYDEFKAEWSKALLLMSCQGNYA